MALRSPKNRIFRPPSFLLITFIILINVNLNIIFTNGTLLRHLIVKRDSGTEDHVRKVLEELAGAITVEHYDSDPILLQIVDSANSRSTYKDPQTDQEFYETGTADKNKPVVVLKSEEDKLPVSGLKRVYIVLRASKIEDKPKKYYPSIAYLVNPGDTPNMDKVTVDGTSYGVEWAVWNDGVLNGFTYSFQFPVCRYSVMIPCKTEAPQGSPSASASANTKNEKAVAEPEENKNKVAFPSNEYSDFFLDLDNNKISGRFQIVGMAFDALSSAVDAVGGLWCGLSNMVLGQCHQYDPEDGYTKSQIGTPVVRSDGKVLASGAHEGFGSDGLLGTIINTVLPQNKAVPTALMYSGSISEAPPPPPYGYPPPPGYPPPGYPPPPGYGRRKRSDGPSVSIKGWRTQFQNTIEANSILKHDKEIFYGLGNCPFVEGTADLYKKASTPEEVIQFYVDLLRMGCVARVRLVIPALKSEGLLKIDQKSIQASPRENKKITWIEEQKLASAFELHAISKTYQQAIEKPESGDSKSPFNTRITKSVKFLENFSMNFIHESKLNMGGTHYVRLLRHLVQILRSVLDKLGEDSSNLDNCTGNCSLDKEVNNNDKLTIMGIIKFIMHGLPYKGVDFKSSYEEFVKKHQPAIEAALREAKL